MQVTRVRVAVVALALSATGFAAWQRDEHFVREPMIPTKGDVPTIGYGSTKYEDGRRVKMTDPPITRERGAVLARNLLSQDEKVFRASLPGVALHPEEYDLYMNFVGQFGTGNWRASSMRRDLLASNYAAACDDLLKYKFSAGYDCSMPGNKVCAGVWSRQLKRYQQCKEAQ
jgi:lysozyme